MILVKNRIKLNLEEDLYNDIQNLKIEQKKISQKLSKSQLKNSFLIGLIVLVLINISMQTPQFFSDDDFFTSPGSSTIDFLRGDTIDTWMSWLISDEYIFHIHVLDNGITPEQMQTITDAVLSKEVLVIDDLITHKGPKGTSSAYFLGWAGALNSINDDTVRLIPKEFHIHKTLSHDGDIVIDLQNYKDSDGNSGFTKTITDNENNQILKAIITIYDSQNLDQGKLSFILRHELGHAFGLKHSSDPNDLMYPTLNTGYELISECDIVSIKELYDGNIESKITCEK